MTFSNYRPSDGENHGQVLCWASNDLGEQVFPLFDFYLVVDQAKTQLNKKSCLQKSKCIDASKHSKENDCCAHFFVYLFPLNLL